MANAGKSKGANPKESQHGAIGAGEVTPGEELDEFDIADERRGSNRLQGKDQARAVEGRYAQAGAKPDPESDLRESFKKQDKDYRAEAARQARRKAASKA